MIGGTSFVHRSPDDGKVHFIMARCARHESVPQLNAESNAMAECGACVGEEMLELLQMLFEVLDAYADRLTHHAVLKAKLASARDRLNLLSPGAADYLDDPRTKWVAE